MKISSARARRLGAVVVALGAVLTLSVVAPTPATKTTASFPAAHPTITLFAFPGGPSGSFPLAGVIADHAGNLYGTTQTDGNGASCLLSGFYGCGVVYRLAPSGSTYTQTVLYSFQGAPNDGALPGFGSLVGDASGSLYGTTSGGGSGTCAVSGLAGCGTAFKLTPSGSNYTESVLYAFKGGRDGAQPLAGLIEDGTGALFGATQEGGRGSCSTSGVAGCGTIFKLSPSASGYSERILYKFAGGSDGAQPVASLIEDASGALYGTTLNGGGGAACGATGCGTVFKLTAGTRRYQETVLYRFSNPARGLLPQGGLMEDASGALYGTTLAGGSGACSASGASGCGTAYKLTPKGAHYAQSVIYAFQGAPNDGSSPGDSLLEHAGALYGTTFLGGSNFCSGEMGAGCGTVFALTPSGSRYTESIVYQFGGNAKAGRLPLAGLIAVHGALFGTTFAGGRGEGTVFKL